VSLGADGRTLGDHNAPSLSYAARVPPLHRDAPEISATVDRARLRVGQPMDDARIAFLVTFMRTLTDQRFEALLDKPN